MAQDVRKTIEDMAYIGVGVLVVGVQQLQIRAREAGSNVSAHVDEATTRLGHHTAPVQDRAAAAFAQASASASSIKDQASATTAGLRAQADGLKVQASALKEQASVLKGQADGLKQQAVALGAEACTRVGGAASGARQSVGPMVDDVRRRAEPVVVQLQAAVPEQLQAASGQIQAVPGLVGDAITTGRDRVRSLIRTGNADTSGSADTSDN
jgi:hypothetical protein